MFCWLDLSDAIERSRSDYDDVRAQALGSPTGSGPILMNVFKVDLDDLRKIPELSDEVERREEVLTSLKMELATDTEKFRSEAQAILKKSGDTPESRAMGYVELESPFNQLLRGWRDARSTLLAEVTELNINQLGDGTPTKWNATTRILKRITNIRRVYSALEIIVPVLFAVFAIVYVWLS